MTAKKKPSMLESTLKKIVDNREIAATQRQSKTTNFLSARFDEAENEMVRELKFKSGLSLKALMMRGFNLQCEEFGIKPLPHAADRRNRG
jgi:hypothetical protein